MVEIGAIVLAAGTSSRYRAAGGVEPTKLTAPWRGQPIVRWAAAAALASRARPVIVVTGHARQTVEAALSDLPLTLVHNPAYATGLASSLRTGIAALGESAAGAAVLLGDMPGITGSAVDSLIAAFLSRSGALAAVPAFAGRRGNPVLLGRGLFDAVARLQGDQGARGLLRDVPPDCVVEVATEDAAVVFDVDTPRQLAAGAEFGSREP
jgi:molybdenum cofactor cytidylyltransferase